MGVCTEIQNKMTACFRNEVIDFEIVRLISSYCDDFFFLVIKLESRRHLGSTNNEKKNLDHYLSKNPRLAEKVKLLEELKKQQEKK